MSELSCEGLFISLTKTSRLFTDLGLSIKQRSIKQAKTLKEQLNEESETIKKKLDVYEIVLREKIAKEKGFSYVGGFHDGWALAVDESKRGAGSGRSILADPDLLFCFVNRDGEKLGILDENIGQDSFYFEKADDFSDGIARVIAVENSSYTRGFYTKEGKLINGFFLKLKPFSEGLAAVANRNSELKMEWTFIDTDGKQVTDETYEDANGFSEGISAVKRDGKWFFVDRNFNPISNEKFDWVLDFQDGIAVVKEDRSKNVYSAINIEGKRVLKPEYSKCSESIDGVRTAESEQGWTFIDRDGNELSEPYESANNFSERLASAKKGDEWIVFDRNLNEKFRIKCSLLTRFKNGFAQAREDLEEIYYINHKGQNICKNKYKYGEFFDSGLAPVRDEDGWILISGSGREVTQKHYEHISYFKDGLFEAAVKIDDSSITSIGGKFIYYYLDRSGREVFMQPTSLKELMKIDMI